MHSNREIKAKKISTPALSIVGGLGLSLLLVLPVQAQPEPTADDFISAMEKINGVYPGERRQKIVGLCVGGWFVGTKDASSYTRSTLFTGAEIPVIGRFSVEGGNPKAPDTSKSRRGLALQFKLPGNQLHHFTMLNAPVFGAATPQTVYDSLLANRVDAATGQADPEAQKAFPDSHPDARPLREFMAKNNPPASYANSNFFGIHAFKFTNAANKDSFVRWEFVPEAGIKRLTDAQLSSMPARFLDADLIDQIQKGPISWTMMVTVGEPGDSQTDPTVYWPVDRKKFVAGRLILASASPQKGGDCEQINFDPLVMSDGVEPTADPVLLFRSLVYEAAYTKRFLGH